MFFKTSTFYYIFTIFQINAEFIINKLTRYFYAKLITPLLYFKMKLLSPSQNLSHVETFLAVFTVDEVCHFSNKYQPPNNLAKYKCFCTRNFTSILHFEKNIGALHRKYFSENRLFTSFSPFLTVREVCNISNKYWIPNKSAGNIFLHQTPTETVPSCHQNICVLHCSIFQKHTHFNTFLLVFTVD